MSLIHRAPRRRYGGTSIIVKFLGSLLLSFVLALPDAAFAGSRGYDVVFINLGEEGFFTSKTYEAFRDGGADQLDAATHCWNRRATDGKSFESIARMSVPKGLDKALGQAIWNRDRKAVASAQKILKTGRGHGLAYDGLYVILPATNSISIIGVGANARFGPNNPSPVVRMAWNPSTPLDAAASLDAAFCKASAPLDVGFSP